MENWCSICHVDDKEVLVSWVVRENEDGVFRSRFRTEFYPEGNAANDLITLIEREEDVTTPFTQKEWELYKNPAVVEKRVTEFLNHKNL